MHSGRLGNGAHRSERIGGLGRAAGTPRTRQLTLTGEHHAHVHRLRRQRTAKHGDLVVGGTTIDRQRVHGSGGVVSEHHLGNAEQRDVSLAAGDVPAQHLEQSRKHSGRELGTVGLERIENRGGRAPRVVRAETPRVEHALGQEHRRQHLDVPGERECLTDRAPALLFGGEATTSRGRRQDRGNLFEPFEPQHLLHQVGALHQVRSPGRRGDDELAVPAVVDRHLDSAADLRQPSGSGSVGVLHSGDAVRQVEVHRDRGIFGCLADIGQHGLDPAAGDLDQQLCCPIERRHRKSRIHGPLETLAGLAGELVSTTGAEHRERIEGCRFEHDLGGRIVDFGGRAAHDTGQRDRSRSVGDDDVLGIEGTLDAVQRGQLLPRIRAADDQIAVELGRIERVQRLAELVEHVVGDIDGRRDRAHTGEQQSTLHPPGCRRRRVDADDLAQRESRCVRGRFDGDRPCVTGDLGGDRARRIHEREIETAGQFTGEAADGEGVPAIGGHVELDDRVLQTQNGFGVVARSGRPLGQHQNSGVIPTQPEFERRADHAVGVAAVRLARRDGESPGQDAARQGCHDQVTLGEVPGSAHDFLRLGGSDVHQAEANRLLELGQLLDRAHPTHHQWAGDVVERVEFLDLEPDPHETGVELLGRHGPVGSPRVQDLGQPGLWDSHVCSALSCIREEVGRVRNFCQA